MVILNNLRIRIASKLHPYTLGLIDYQFSFDFIKTIFIRFLWKVITYRNHSLVIETWMFHGKRFKINANHGLIDLKSKWPYYDTSITEISSFIQNKHGDFTSIDIGANIGDTALHIRMGSRGKILCIEPSTNFFKILKSNIESIKPVELLNVFVGERGKVADSLEETEGGTAIASLGLGKNNPIKTKSIDEIVELYPEFRKSRLIKIDTDGWDLSVIKSASNLINKCKPFIFFEFMPELIIKYGEDDPLNVINILKEINYNIIIIYDGYGYLYGKVDLKKEKEYLSFFKLFTNCTRDLSPFWLDILACHEDNINEINEFYEKESKRIR